MPARQVDGIDAYDFPSDLLGHPLLTWMGDDYVQFIATELLRRFKRQDSATEMLAIKCEQQPDLQARVNEPTGMVHEVVAIFDLQVLLRSSDQRCWRLRAEAQFAASGLDQPKRNPVTVGFEIRSSEEAL